MELLHMRCAGLDVHQHSVVACARLVDEAGRLSEEVRTFDTTTKGLLELSEWLQELGCDHVAMEATGVYWKPKLAWGRAFGPRISLDGVHPTGIASEFAVSPTGGFCLRRLMNRAGHECGWISYPLLRGGRSHVAPTSVKKTLPVQSLVSACVSCM